MHLAVHEKCDYAVAKFMKFPQALEMLDVKNAEGETPLDVAKKAGASTIVQRLEEKKLLSD